MKNWNSKLLFTSSSQKRSNYSAWMQLFTFFKVNDRSLMPIEHSTIGVALCEKLTPSELFSFMAQNKNGYDISKSLGLSFDLFWIWSWAKLRLVWGNSVSQFLRWIPFPKILLILSHNPRQQITTAFSLKTSDFFCDKRGLPCVINGVRKFVSEGFWHEARQETG